MQNPKVNNSECQNLYKYKDYNIGMKAEQDMDERK